MSFREATSSAACWIAFPIFGSYEHSAMTSSYVDGKITKSKIHVHRCCCSFQYTKRSDNGRGHSVLRLINLEIFQRTLSLCSPVSVRGHLDLAEGIGLCSCRLDNFEVSPLLLNVIAHMLTLNQSHTHHVGPLWKRLIDRGWRSGESYMFRGGSS